MASAIDLSLLLEISEDDDAHGQAEFLKALIGIFLASTPAIIENIRVFLEKGQRSKLGFECHNLKSYSNNMGARRVAGICQQLEDYASKKCEYDQNTLMELLTDLEKNYRLVTEELQTIFSQESQRHPP